MKRRTFIQTSVGLLAAGTGTLAGATDPVNVPATPAPGWDSGRVAHLLPTVSDRQLLLKISLTEPLAVAPVLYVGKRKITGLATDTAGMFWSFAANNLAPDTALPLRLTMADGKPLCDAWTIRTFPAPTTMPTKFRLLIYTCAGGHDALKTATGNLIFLPLELRKKLVEMGLSFEPNALIANGDHVYWDLESKYASAMGKNPYAIQFAGTFDRSLPVLGTANETVLKKAVGPQIADLYGTSCRATPVFFLKDDHDYFENDEASEALITFPPGPFSRALADATQRLFYPEFLPDAHRPATLPGTKTDGTSENFGTLRYGKLVEMLLFDCRAFLTLTGDTGTFVPPDTERWLTNRIGQSDTAHVVSVPSTPMGWSAGKWAEWYPDLLAADKKLSTAVPKPYWQRGWFLQHNRLLAAISAQKTRIPLVVSGDLHSTAAGTISRSGPLDLSSHPVVSCITGTIGTGPTGFPSAARGVRAMPPVDLTVEEQIPALEENGFCIMDFTPTEISIQFFRFKRAEIETATGQPKPFKTLTMSRL